MKHVITALIEESRVPLALDALMHLQADGIESRPAPRRVKAAGKCWCGEFLIEHRIAPGSDWIRECPDHGTAYHEQIEAV